MAVAFEIAGHGAKIGRKQEDAIAALLTEPTLVAAAGAAGIGEKTLRRWLHDPGFQAAYQQARRAAFGRAIGRMQQAAERAAAVMIETMNDPKVATSIRLRAAKDVWEIAHETFETEDLEHRVTSLEQKAAEKRGEGGAIAWPRERSG